MVSPQRIGSRRLALGHGAVELAQEDLVLAKVGENRLVKKMLHILGVVVSARCRRPTAGLFAVVGVARVDALEDAQTAKVCQRDLQLLDGARPRDVVGGGARGALQSVSGQRLAEQLAADGRGCPPGIRTFFFIRAMVSVDGEFLY